MTGPDWKVWVFATTISERVTKKEIHEGVIDWYSVDLLPKDVVPNLYWLIPFSKDKILHPELTSFVVWYGALPAHY